MSEEKSKAIIDAEKDFTKYGTKECTCVAEKYVECINRLTAVLNKHNSGQELNDRDFYDFEYCQFMEQHLRLVLSDFFLQGLGYTKDKNGIWGKKKKGFFK